jgi:hypothetical protein
MALSQTDLNLRILAEFREMPGMCLTIAQAARLWALEGSEAARATEHFRACRRPEANGQGSYLLRSR